MSQTVAHLVDHVIPHVPVRQWVLSLPSQNNWVSAVRRTVTGLAVEPPVAMSKVLP